MSCQTLILNLWALLNEIGKASSYIAEKKKKKNWGELTLVLTFSSTLVLSNEIHSVPFREGELKGLQEWQDKNKMIKNIFDKALSTEAMQQKFSGTLFSSVRWSWSYSHTIKKCNNKENCLYTTSFT